MSRLLKQSFRHRNTNVTLWFSWKRACLRRQDWVLGSYVYEMSACWLCGFCRWFSAGSCVWQLVRSVAVSKFTNVVQVISLVTRLKWDLITSLLHAAKSTVVQYVWPRAPFMNCEQMGQIVGCTVFPVAIIMMFVVITDSNAEMCNILVFTITSLRCQLTLHAHYGGNWTVHMLYTHD